MGLITRAFFFTFCAMAMGTARGQCISDQAGLEAALMVEDGSRVFVCRDTTIEISNTVEISPTANVIVQCRNMGCKITTSSNFNQFDDIIGTPEGVTSTHKVKFAGISFVQAGNSASSLFTLIGGSTTISKGKECVIQGNAVFDSLLRVSGGVLRIIGCDIVSNESKGNMIRGINGSTLFFKGLNLKSNTAAILDVMNIENSSMVMNSVNVTSNSGKKDVFEFSKGRVRMTRVNFVDNQAGDFLTYFGPRARITMKLCLFKQNKAGQDIVASVMSRLVASDTTFVENDGIATLYVENRAATLNNVLFDNNVARAGDEYTIV